MIQMVREIHIPMPPGRDMEIPLHLVPLHAPIHPTRIGLHAPGHVERTRELLPPARRAQVVVHVLLLRVLPMLLLLPRLARARRAARARAVAVSPPDGVVVHEGLACEDAIPGCVLHVHVQVVAAHGDDKVQVQLHGARDALFDAEGVGCGTDGPVVKLGGQEVQADEGGYERGDLAVPCAG